MNFSGKASKIFRGLITILILVLSVSSCYEPDEYVPPVYLESEVSLIVDNTPWDSVSETGLTVDLQNNILIMSLFNSDQSSIFSCVVKGDNSNLFNDYSGSRETLPIKPLTYWTNDSLSVEMYYRSSIDGAKIITGNQTVYWYGSDPEFNVWIISDAFIERGERYISGSFTARTFHANSNQFPRYRYIEGSFKNIRISETHIIER
ncbi:MAG: hypothetical protein RLO81_06545 [Fulvivirga sp.]|uniref:hypothetical protein n=1 Tax=Fulvivirga sp. TaxID=1931237 RepID=UPI0032EF3517